MRKVVLDNFYVEGILVFKVRSVVMLELVCRSYELSDRMFGVLFLRKDEWVG